MSIEKVRSSASLKLQTQKDFDFLEQIRIQIDIERYQTIAGGLLNDSTIQNFEKIAD